MEHQGIERVPLDKRPYFTVANELFRHPKFVRLTDKAKVHLLSLWGYCNEYTTNGIVHESVLNGQGAATAKLLIEIGWVESTATKGEYYMHDYLEHQKSKQRIEVEKSIKQTAGSVGGQKSHHSRNHAAKGVFDASCQWCQEAQKSV